MAAVTVRDLRNHGGDVLARVERGETLVVTRDGRPVARVVPLGRASPSPSELVARRQHLPRVDVRAFRADVDDVLEASV